MIKYIVANWKMNGSKTLVQQYKNLLQNDIPLNFFIAPPAPYLDHFSECKNAILTAQDISDKKAGAFTGQISGEILHDIRCKSVIIGHSETRKEILTENETLSMKSKIEIAIECQLIPIYCIGETQANKNEGINIISQQLSSIPIHLINQKNQQIIIAYEPRWAIGSGKIPTLNEINQTHGFIKNFLQENQIQNSAVIYGGSVNLQNANDILSESNVDGLIIGGMSLKVNDMLQLLNTM